MFNKRTILLVVAAAVAAYLIWKYVINKCPAGHYRDASGNCVANPGNVGP